MASTLNLAAAGGGPRSPTKTTNEAEFAMKWTTPLQERTNGGIIARSGFPRPAGLLPAQPRPKHSPPRNGPSKPLSDSRKRRLARYDIAEQKLSTTLLHTTSAATAQDLQIRALEQATSLLALHAVDAQARVARLRVILAARAKDVDDEKYEAMQRERWMKERWVDEVGREAEAVERVLRELKNGDVAFAAEDDAARSGAKRREANLVKFFNTSAAWAPIFTQKDAQMRTSFVDCAPRRMTMGDVSPMRLRPDSITSFSLSGKGRSRSVSFNGRWKAPKDGWAPVGGRPLRVENITEQSDTSTVSTASSLPPNTVSDIQPNFIYSPTTLPHRFSDDIQGIATIYYPDPIRSKADIIADLLPTNVPIPDYAVDLFENFDARPDIPIRLAPLPRSDGPRERSAPRHRTGTSHPIASWSSLPNTPPPRAATPPSTLDKPPSSTPGATPSRRHLHMSLFSIPEAISSMVGVSASGNSTANQGAQREAVVTPKHSVSFFSALKTRSAGVEKDPGKMEKKRFFLLRKV